MTDKIFMVKYIEQNTIEGYVKDKDGFLKWLKEYNRIRKQDGNLIENEWEFELTELEVLK